MPPCFHKFEHAVLLLEQPVHGFWIIVFEAVPAKWLFIFGVNGVFDGNSNQMGPLLLVELDLVKSEDKEEVINCSITVSGLVMPPVQKLVNILSICDFSSPVIKYCLGF